MFAKIGALVSAVVAAGLLVPAAAPGQGRDEGEWCRDWSDNDRGWFCEVRETTLSADRDLIEVDGGTNGGVSVIGWDRNEILVRAKVWAQARSDDDAEEMVREVQIETSRAIQADGPSTGRRESWGVSFEVFVPRSSDLDLKAHNGGIGVQSVRGEVAFRTQNGGVHLDDVGGSVSGRTQNGGLDIQLTGTAWDGEGLDVLTQNGGVRITVPENYSAHLVTGTTNGGLRVDFPVTVQGRIGRELSVDLGNGGRTVRAKTTNGGVTVRRG